MLLLVEWHGEECECTLGNDVWIEMRFFCVYDGRERHGWSESVSVPSQPMGTVENLISSAGIR